MAGGRDATERQDYSLLLRPRAAQSARALRVVPDLGRGDLSIEAHSLDVCASSRYGARDTRGTKRLYIRHSDTLPKDPDGSSSTRIARVSSSRTRFDAIIECEANRNERVDSGELVDWRRGSIRLLYKTRHRFAALVYSKLPRAFFIPTPVGDYNPGWAIAFRDDTTMTGRIYVVAETKMSTSTLTLGGVEEAKIERACKFSASFNEKAAKYGVKYDVVDTYENLLALLGPQ